MKVLFSAYRLDQFTDPDAFMVNIGAVLEQYPVETIRFVTDPRTGVQRRCKFPPTVAEAVDACNEHRANVAKTDRFNTWGKRDAIEGPQEPKPTLSELHERHGNHWGLGGRDFPDVARIRQMTAAGLLQVGRRYTGAELVEISNSMRAKSPE